MVAAAIVIAVGCSRFDPDRSSDLSRALNNVDGIEVVEIREQRDEILAGRLLDAIIRVRGHELMLLSLDPAQPVDRESEHLVVLSMDGLIPVCRLASGEIEGGLDLPLDPRTANLRIRSVPDLVAQAEKLHSMFQQSPRAEDEAIEVATTDGSPKQCWIRGS